MSRRTERVGELLRRELATMLVNGEVRDPRLAGVAVSITAVRVSGDLSHARVFVDFFDSEAGTERDRRMAALHTAAPMMRRALRGRVHLRQTPELHFMADESISTGARIETILGELKASDTPPTPETPESAEHESTERDE